MRTIRAQDLKTMLSERDDVVLIDVLAEDAFAKEHIAQSHNIPQSREDFARQVEDLAGGKDRPVVVYCASKDCQASPAAARKLAQAGFTDVTDFEGGVAEWKLAGYDVVRGAPVGATS